jgi:NADH-quinone oxidoreductase subunit N
MRKMYMEEGPDMRRVKEPRAISAVLIFAMIFMVGFGIWHAPILDFATNSVPNLSQLVSVLPSVPIK